LYIELNIIHSIVNKHISVVKTYSKLYTWMD
jgi:hypothetical protein